MYLKVSLLLLFCVSSISLGVLNYALALCHLIKLLINTIHASWLSIQLKLKSSIDLNIHLSKLLNMHKNNIVITLTIIMGIVIGACNQLSESSNHNNENLKTIFGKVVQTSAYCGGAAPTQEILDEFEREKPYPDKILYIKDGDVNLFSKPIIKELASDKDGNFEISLPQGKYCIIEQIKKDELKIPDYTEINKIYEQQGQPLQYRVDEQCFKDWWKTCDKILVVENQDIKDFVIKFGHSCGWPCVSGGPLPS